MNLLAVRPHGPLGQPGPVAMHTEGERNGQLMRRGIYLLLTCLLAVLVIACVATAAPRYRTCPAFGNPQRYGTIAWNIHIHDGSCRDAYEVAYYEEMTFTGRHRFRTVRPDGKNWDFTWHTVWTPRCSRAIQFSGTTGGRNWDILGNTYMYFDWGAYC